MSVQDELIAVFKAQDWASKPFEKLRAYIDTEPDQIFPLCKRMLKELPKGGTFFDALESFLSKEEFEAMVPLSVEQLREKSTGSAESVISYCSLQFPHLLTPYLEELYELEPNNGSYYQYWPWRAADQKEINRLKSLIKMSEDFNTRSQAWECLLNTRTLDALAFCHENIDAEPTNNRIDFIGWSRSVGFQPYKDTFTPLHAPLTHHICFPKTYFQNADTPAWIMQDNHPTWKTHKAVASEVFGGQSDSECGYCGKALHRLFTLSSPKQLSLPISLSALEIGTCISCLGWEVEELFFQHDENGIPHSLPPGQKDIKPQFPSEPILQSNVTLSLTEDRWHFQDWALSNGRENLNRIGGLPSWIQYEQYPNCPKCQNVMAFIAQLDSELPLDDESYLLWGSGGICYLFWCDNCSISGSLWQCT